MRKKLTLYISLIVFVALVLMFGLGLLVTRSISDEMTGEKLIELERVYALAYKSGTPIEESGDVRITVISSSGIVLSDTGAVDLDKLENHLSREEVQFALNGNPTLVSRYSETLGRDMLYYAEKLNLADGDYVILRAATSTESVAAYLVKTIPLMLLILFGVLCVAVVISYILSDKLIRPFFAVKDSLLAVGDGTYKQKIPCYNYPELNEAVSEINDLSLRISDNLTETTREKTKLDYIIKNISDGIVVVGSDNAIKMLNGKAKEIFGISGDIVGDSINYLTSDEALCNAISNVKLSLGIGCALEFKQDKSTYLVSIKRLDGWDEDGKNVAVAIFTDITLSKENEKQRSEFFANASHELKTPLTAIKGFNEIVGMTNKDEKLVKPIEQIAKESDRMLTLIDDMLKLSRLENTETIQPVLLNLREISEEVVADIQPIIDSKNISVSFSGEGAVKAERKHIYELLLNITENAVKYNNDGGKVNINISSNESETSISVADNGIGIDASHQSRIFERFYRVEKSRSRSSGGTGLGLSIVKHICLLYNADIALNSKVGIGTTLTVTFKNSI